MEETKVTKKSADTEKEPTNKDAEIEQLKKEVEYYKQVATDANNCYVNLLELYNELFMKYISKK